VIALGVTMACRNLASAFHTAIRDVEEFDRAPGCQRGAPQIDNTLPPCVIAPVTVTSLTTRTIHSDVNVNGQTTVYDMSVRDAAGRTTELRNVFDYVWSDMRVGETVNATYWQGRLMELDRGRDDYPVLEQSPDVATLFAHAIIWLVVAFAGLLGLDLFTPLCLSGRRRRPGFLPGLVRPWRGGSPRKAGKGRKWRSL